MQWPRSTPTVALAVDAAVAAAFSVLALAELGLRWDDGNSAGPAALNVPLLLLITLPLAVRRRAPLLALAVAFGAVVVPSLVVAHTLFFFGGLVPLALLVYTGARLLPRQRSWLAGLGPVALLLAYPLHVPAFDAADYAFGAVLFGAAFGAGWLVRGLEAQRARLAEALAGALREREAREHALLLDERARIARELHDVVASAVSVMVVQTGAARFALERSSAEAVSRLLAVEEAGRAAMADLRRLLGLLRTGEEEDGNGEPLPGLDRLPELAAFLQRAGLTVDLRMENLPTGLSTALDVTAHRVVQEALTNVLKHSAATRAEVRVRATPGCLVLEVQDDGPARPGGSGLSTGHGLVGMRERVAVFDGRLQVGPSDGGWSVRAELPLTASGAEVPA